jgi:hypothetical protein
MYNVGRKESEMDVRKLRSRAQEMKITLILNLIPEAQKIIVVIGRREKSNAQI